MSEMDRRIAGALYGFLGYLTTLDKPITMGGSIPSPPALDSLKAYAEQSGVNIDADPLFPGDEPDPCPECKGTKEVLSQPHDVPSVCMACYVHEEKLGTSDLMTNRDWHATTMNGAKAGFTLTCRRDGLVDVTVRRFGS